MRLLATISALCIIAWGCRSATRSESADTTDQTASDSPSSVASFDLIPVGEIVDDYEVRTLDGDPAHIGPSQPVTLVNLWATWCAPCRIEFPDLETLHQELSPAGLRLLAVDVDAEPVGVLEAFADDLGLTLSIARDTLGAIQQALPYVGVPTSFLIAKNGSLVRGWTGIIPKEDYTFIEHYVRTHGSAG